MQDEGAHALEGFGSYDSGTNTFTLAQAQRMSKSFTQSDGGFTFGFYANAYGNNDADELTASDDYSDPSSQWGGAGWTGIGGSKFDWTARCDGAYRSGVRRMIYTDNQGSGPDNVEFASWKHYDNNTAHGRVYSQVDAGPQRVGRDTHPIATAAARAYLDQQAGDGLGHVAAGITRDGQPFATLYHGAHRVFGDL